LFDLSASKNQLRGDVVPISCYAPTERGGPPREKIKSFSIFFPKRSTCWLSVSRQV
jgi:hypothetical protein